MLSFAIERLKSNVLDLDLPKGSEQERNKVKDLVLVDSRKNEEVKMIHKVSKEIVRTIDEIK
jgi:hypothetical protein